MYRINYKRKKPIINLIRIYCARVGIRVIIKAKNTIKELVKKLKAIIEIYVSVKPEFKLVIKVPKIKLRIEVPSITSIIDTYRLII